mgnify:FL=1|tara:strand:- start:1870 stop:2694 length:825 start_codon:yes stop_codon:yes gene_type:complete
MSDESQGFDNNWLNVSSSPFTNELYDGDDPAFYLDQVAVILFSSMAKLAMLLKDWPEVQQHADRCWKKIPAIVANYQGAILIKQNPIASFSLLRDSLSGILSCMEAIHSEHEDEPWISSADQTLTSLIDAASEHFLATSHEINHSMLKLGSVVGLTHLCFEQSSLTSAAFENTTPMLAHRLAAMDLSKVGNIAPQSELTRFPMLVGLLLAFKHKWIDQLESQIGSDAIGVRARLFDALETEIYPGIDELMYEEGYVFPKWASTLLFGNYDWASE